MTELSQVVQTAGEENNGLFTRALGIQRGDRVAIIGCGGKTSLMYRLAEEHRKDKVLISTTTRIFRPLPEQYDWEIDGRTALDSCQLVSPQGITLVHGGEEKGKLYGPPPELLARLQQLYDFVFLECDGSRGLPLKGWAEYEPVIPDFTSLTIGVCTLWPVGRSLSEDLTHRLDRFTELTGTQAGDKITPALIAAMLSHPRGMFRRGQGRKILLINQVEDLKTFQLADELINSLPSSFRTQLAKIVLCSLKENIVWQK